jgi:hypothetical protein
MNNNIIKTTKRLIIVTGVMQAVVVGGWAQDARANRFVICNDYYTVGASLCKPKAATPVFTQAPKETSMRVAPTPAAQSDKVKDFLDNYGKPPREFVEFYMNPTPDNAQRWVAAYKEQQARTAAVAEAWKRASAAEGQGGSARITPQTPSPAILPAAPIAPKVFTPQSGAQIPLPSGAIRLGGYSAVTGAKTDLTYYFSAVCPYCVRLKPSLASFAQTHLSKLKFTCVDLTPLSTKSGPSPQNLQGLPCDWRTPRDGEVESLGITQTPTLFVQKGSTPPTRLVGLFPMEQLQGLVK